MALSGQLDPGTSMFGNIHAASIAPSVEEMEAGRDKALYDKDVKIAGHFVRIFDLHDDKQRKDYEKTIAKLLARMQSSECKLWQNERQVLPRGDGSHGWFAYLEWSEFLLESRPGIPVGVGI